MIKMFRIINISKKNEKMLYIIFFSCLDLIILFINDNIFYFFFFFNYIYIYKLDYYVLIIKYTHVLYTIIQLST